MCNLGPALFTLAIYDATSNVKDNLNVWYLNDGCIDVDPQTVLSNSTTIRNGLSSIGLDSKCELLLIYHTNTNKPQTSKLFQDQFPPLSIPDPNHWQLLESPLHEESAHLHLG